VRLIAKAIRISHAKISLQETIVEDIQDYGSLIFWDTVLAEFFTICNLSRHILKPLL